MQTSICYTRSFKNKPLFTEAQVKLIQHITDFEVLGYMLPVVSSEMETLQVRESLFNMYFCIILFARIGGL